MFFLIIFAIEQLIGLVDADVYFTSWDDLTIVEKFGSLENQVEIYDICKTDNGYYLVGGAVRYGDYGGMDAIVFYFEDEIEWYKTYGGNRDEAFLSCYYDDGLYVSGYTYSQDFLGVANNFRTGFYMELNEDGTEVSKDVIPFSLDVMPTVIWKDSVIHIAGYLDNFGNTDIFMYDDKLKIFPYSGQDRIFRKKGENFLGSTTSNELGAINRNLLEWNPSSYVVTPSIHDQSYWYFDEIGEELSLQGEIYSDEILVTKEEYTYTITMMFPEIQCQNRERVVAEGTVYEYCSAEFKGNTYFFDLKKLYEYQNNIGKDVYYGSFTLLFSGSGILNGRSVVTGEVLGVGEYTFESNGIQLVFEVKENDTEFIFTTFEQEKISRSEEKKVNRKLIYLPLIILGNWLYKKYQ